MKFIGISRKTLFFLKLIRRKKITRKALRVLLCKKKTRILDRVLIDVPLAVHDIINLIK